MSLVLCHDCPKCGAELLIDTDKQIYSCGFCGMTYDFDYFDTANLLSVANRALGRGEFSSARKMFEELSWEESQYWVKNVNEIAAQVLFS